MNWIEHLYLALILILLLIKDYLKEKRIDEKIENINLAQDSLSKAIKSIREIG
jgi:hypothetical protein